jgi:hypothetical protein
MCISLKESRETGFKQWSDAHPPASNDNPEIFLVSDALVKPLEAPRGPWLVPGITSGKMVDLQNQQMLPR